MNLIKQVKSGVSTLGAAASEKADEYMVKAVDKAAGVNYQTAIEWAEVFSDSIPETINFLYALQFAGEVYQVSEAPSKHKDYFLYIGQSIDAEAALNEVSPLVKKIPNGDILVMVLKLLVKFNRKRKGFRRTLNISHCGYCGALLKGSYKCPNCGENCYEEGEVDYFGEFLETMDNHEPIYEPKTKHKFLNFLAWGFFFPVKLVLAFLKRKQIKEDILSSDQYSALQNIPMDISAQDMVDLSSYLRHSAVSMGNLETLTNNGYKKHVWNKLCQSRAQEIMKYSKANLRDEPDVVEEIKNNYSKLKAKTSGYYRRFIITVLICMLGFAGILVVLT